MSVSLIIAHVVWQSGGKVRNKLTGTIRKTLYLAFTTINELVVYKMNMTRLTCIKHGGNVNRRQSTLLG